MYSLPSDRSEVYDAIHRYHTDGSYNLFYGKQTPRLPLLSTYELLELIRVRPAMFMGNKTLSHLASFLAGYTMWTLFNTSEPLPIDNPSFGEFSFYVQKHFNQSRSAKGWAMVITEECRGDHKKAFSVFYDLVDKFRKARGE